MKGVLGAMRESHCYRVMIWIDEIFFKFFFLIFQMSMMAVKKDLQLVRSGLK